MKFTEGDLVKFKNKLYWVYEVYNKEELIIIPEDDWDFLEETIFLGRALRVKTKTLDPPN